MFLEKVLVNCVGWLQSRATWSPSPDGTRTEVNMLTKKSTFSEEMVCFPCFTDDTTAARVRIQGEKNGIHTWGVCLFCSFFPVNGNECFFFSICFMDLLFFYLLTFGNKEYFMSVYLEHFKWISWLDLHLKLVK